MAGEVEVIKVLEGVIAPETALCDLEGANGRMAYRGYDIADLARYATFEEVDLEKSGYTPLQLFDGLWQVATEHEPHFPGVKIGAARCERVYPITFLHGNRDYYGIDIDLAARLLAKASEPEVVIEQRFYDVIQSLYKQIGNQEQFDSVRRLTGPTRKKLKGIPE
jgi:class 3 adenylate cyclase